MQGSHTVELKDSGVSTEGLDREEGPCRSRSGSPASFQISSFEREKSPFLAVKSQLKPVRKTKAGNTDWRQVTLKPRSSPLALRHLNKSKVSKS